MDGLVEEKRLSQLVEVMVDGLIEEGWLSQVVEVTVDGLVEEEMGVSAG